MNTQAGLSASITANLAALDGFSDGGNSTANLATNNQSGTSSDTANGSDNLSGTLTGTLNNSSTVSNFAVNDNSKGTFTEGDNETDALTTAATVAGSAAAAAASGATAPTPSLVENGTSNDTAKSTGGDNLTVIENGTWYVNGMPIVFRMADASQDAYLAADGEQVTDAGPAVSGTETETDGTTGVDGYLVSESLPTMQVNGFTVQVFVQDKGSDQSGSSDGANDQEAVDGSVADQANASDKATGGDNYGLSASGTKVVGTQSSWFTLTDSGTGRFKAGDASKANSSGTASDLSTDAENTRETYSERDGSVALDAAGTTTTTTTEDLSESKTGKSTYQEADALTFSPTDPTQPIVVTTTTHSTLKTTDNGSETTATLLVSPTLTFSSNFTSAQQTSSTQTDHEVLDDGVTFGFVHDRHDHTEDLESNLSAATGQYPESAYWYNRVTDDSTAHEAGSNPENYTFTQDRTLTDDTPYGGDQAGAGGDSTYAQTNHYEYTLHTAGEMVNSVVNFDAETRDELRTITNTDASQGQSYYETVQIAAHETGSGVTAAYTIDTTNTSNTADPQNLHVAGTEALYYGGMASQSATPGNTPVSLSSAEVNDLGRNFAPTNDGMLPGVQAALTALPTNPSLDLSSLMSASASSGSSSSSSSASSGSASSSSSSSSGSASSASSGSASSASSASGSMTASPSASPSSAMAMTASPSTSASVPAADQAVPTSGTGTPPLASSPAPAINTEDPTTQQVAATDPSEQQKPSPLVPPAGAALIMLGMRLVMGAPAAAPPAPAPAAPPAPEVQAAPREYIIPDNVFDAIQEQWLQSFEPGGDVRENGGSIIQTRQLTDVVRMARPGERGKMPLENYPKPGDGEALVGRFHTHPYSAQEGGI